MRILRNTEGQSTYWGSSGAGVLGKHFGTRLNVLYAASVSENKASKHVRISTRQQFRRESPSVRVFGVLRLVAAPGFTTC